MGPKIAKELCSQAGFQSFQMANIQSTVQNFFLVRKIEPSL